MRKSLSKTGFRHDEEPGETHHEERGVDEHCVKQYLGYAILAQTVEDGGQLLADQHEQHGLQEEDEHPPEGDVSHAGRGVREDPGVPPAAIETVGDHGQDARDVQHLLGEDVYCVGREQGERDEDRGLPDAGPQR